VTDNDNDNDNDRQMVSLSAVLSFLLSVVVVIVKVKWRYVDAVIVKVNWQHGIGSLEDEARSADPACLDAVGEESVISNFKETVGGKYVLKGYEYNPTITHHDGPYVGSYNGPCVIVNANDAVVMERPVIMVDRFDVFNIYEMMHSLINTYILIKKFGLLADAVIMFVDGAPRTPLNTDMYGVFTDVLIYSDKTTCYYFKKGVFKSPAEFSSILVTKHGPLKGRGVAHHCRSTLLRSFVNMVKRHFDVPYDDGHVRASNNTIWSSRGTHKRGTNKKYSPTRALLNEGPFVDELRATTDRDITVVDFAQLSASESIRLMSDTDMAVGVHGAGLMWTAFMPRHSGVVEIFGGDRPSNNQHYHNVASLSDLHYRATSHAMPASGRNLKWDRRIVQEVSSAMAVMAGHRLSEPM
jgi:hypothetical protein